MHSTAPGTVRRTTAAVTAALAACLVALALVVGGPTAAHAATTHAAPKCPAKSYFLHKLQKRGTGAKRIDSLTCAGQWAGVVATSRVTFNTLWQHQPSGNWAYRPRNKHNCNAIPKKLDYICQSD